MIGPDIAPFTEAAAIVYSNVPQKAMNRLHGLGPIKIEYNIAEGTPDRALMDDLAAISQDAALDERIDRWFNPIVWMPPQRTIFFAEIDFRLQRPAAGWNVAGREIAAITHSRKRNILVVEI